MALQHLTTAPKTSDFTPLQEHQEQTPTTFFGSKPVLHAHFAGLALSIPTSKLQADPAFSHFTAEQEQGTEKSLIKNIDIFVNSEDLILFQNASAPTGVSIPYPSIALHATMKYNSSVDALYMNVSLNDASNINDEDDIQVLEITVLPPNFASTPSQADTACIRDIFTAMNTCADLHPDPDGSEEDGAGEDETAPGATGWITAENMDDFMDENGNFRGTVVGGEEDLGPGAGTVRPREEDGDEHVNGVNGVDGETKWQRTD